MSELTGRPRTLESRRRTRELVRLVAEGAPLVEAARRAGVKPTRVLRLLDEPEFFAVYQAVRSGGVGPTAVVLDAPAGAAAA